MPRFVPCALALMMGLASMGSGAEDAPLLPFKATERTLANGLRVIVVPTGFPNIVSIQIPVQTGARNEVEPGKSGFAHVFEHMMCRGPPTYPPAKYQALLTKAGARSNAFTADDFTNSHTTFAKEDLEAILAAEADRFQNLEYSEEAFKTESRAVLGEYNKNSTNPIRKILEVQRDHAYSVHTYKHTGMGFLKDIEDMPNQFEYSKTFFSRWYRPENTTVIVTGDVTPEGVFPLVEKYWSAWKSGSQKVEIPQEPAAKAAVYAHVPWTQPTLPYVTVAFHSPAFSESGKDFAAMDTLLNLTFGQTSDVYKRLVEQEQKVDQLFVYFPDTVDPALATVAARVKKAEDVVYVRDEVMKAFAAAAAEPVSGRRLAEAKANARYSLLRSLDNTKAIASTLAAFVRYRRSFDTINNLYRVYDSLSPEDLHQTAARYFVDNGLVVTTLAKDPLPDAVATLPLLASLRPSAVGNAAAHTVKIPSSLPQLNVKLLFAAGSAHDPRGKEGLAALSAAMVASGGSKALRIDEINKALFPIAASFTAQVDKEMTTFTGIVHRDNGGTFLDVALPQLTDPGFRDEDFRRLKDAQKNALQDDLKSGNDEELGKEQLQAGLFAGTPYGHPVLGTLAGIDAITLDDVKAFVKANYGAKNLSVGLSGDVPPEFEARLTRELAALSTEPAPAAPAGVVAHKPAGREVEIVQKDTRATAISFGFPIPVTRSHPDFPALALVRSWLGEHRASMARLFERIREERGMNYGDYAYIEAFPRGMYQFFPDPNLARRAQLFEVWLRPLRSNEDAHFALRVAIHELDLLAKNGLTEEQFQNVRNYLMKNVYVMTATQDQAIGYALDSQWYGISDYPGYMRERLAKLTRADVNRVVKKYVQTRDLRIVMITGDAEDLKKRLTTDQLSSIKYDGEKPAALLAEDKVIGASKLAIRPEAVRIVPVAEVFAAAP